MVCADIKSCSGGPRISDYKAFFRYRDNFCTFFICRIFRVKRSISESATVLVAAVKGWGNKSAGGQTLIIKRNKEILAKRVELSNREK